MKIFVVAFTLLSLKCNLLVQGFSSTSILQHSLTRLFWSKQAVVDVDSKSPELVDSTTLNGKEADVDLSSPRLWLEGHPDGIYTCMRSDLFVSVGEIPWRLWGVNFHLERLKKNYRKLYSPEESAVEKAVESSVTIAGSLLADTFGELRNVINLSDPGATCVVMLTILWYPREDGTIGVRGHVYTTEKAVNPRVSNLTPIKVGLALESKNVNSLPSRKSNHPECKQSSWCTQRRPLEEMFKTDGVEEVLLTDQEGDAITLLEGLTSNCFFVYPNNVIKTPASGILKGYARQRVMKAATKLGYRVEEGPVTLAETALWKEVFITSAIRLIQPVDVIVDTQGDDSVCVWKEDPIEQNSAIPAWQSIYNRILSEESL